MSDTPQKLGQSGDAPVVPPGDTINPRLVPPRGQPDFAYSATIVLRIEADSIDEARRIHLAATARARLVEGVDSARGSLLDLHFEGPA